RLSNTDLGRFFEQYVAGTEELPYDEVFATVGLALEKESRVVADPGFNTARNFTAPLIIDEVYGDQAKTVGLHEGDDIVEVDGKQRIRRNVRQLTSLKPGKKVRNR